MLAEPRTRQKWSDDPRNTRWANDKSKFGYQMLTKMGWSEGKGLGQNETGRTSHVKIRKKKSNAGIGSKHSHDDDWIAHQNDFNDLLSSLNQGLNGNKDHEIKSLEDRVKTSRKKILYKRFVKSKDLANASSHDLACIFGTRSKSAPATPQLSDDESQTSDNSTASCPVNQVGNDHGFTTVNTGVSVADYFAQKMAALKRSQCDGANSHTSSIDETQCKDSEGDLLEGSLVKKKKKKKKKRVAEKCSEEKDKDLCDSGALLEMKDTTLDLTQTEKSFSSEENEDIKKKKKKKKRKTEDDVEEIDVRSVKKKKTSCEEDIKTQKKHAEEMEDNCLSGQNFKKKKKKKKRKEEC